MNGWVRTNRAGIKIERGDIVPQVCILPQVDAARHNAEKRTARRRWAEENLTGSRPSVQFFSDKPGAPIYGPDRPPLYQMVYDKGPPEAWSYGPPMTWDALMNVLRVRRQAGCSLPGHVHNAALPVSQDPYRCAR